jgi:hypothetical protein
MVYSIDKEAFLRSQKMEDGKRKMEEGRGKIEQYNNLTI